MSKNPQCENCGGTDYILESGYYFCSECNVQSQEIIEQVYDFYGGRTTTVTKQIPAATVNDESVQKDSSLIRKSLTSWEVLNHILVGLVKELELLGASPELKRITLKLWAQYLMKIEVAFISKQVQKKPRLGVLFRKIDAELVYGAPENVSQAHRKPIYRPRKRKRVKSSSAVSDTSRTTASSRSEKHRLTLKKKALAKAEYLESGSMLSQSSILTMESLSETLSQASSQRSNKLRYTKHAKRSFVSLLESAKDLQELERKEVQSKLMSREAISVRHVTLMRIVAVLRLALILAEQDIHLADLFRWTEEGYLSLRNAEKLLPNDVTVEKDVKGVFGNYPDSRYQTENKVGNLSTLLGFHELKVNLRPTIVRYCNELSLPDEIMDIIDKLIYIHPAEVKVTTTSNYEGRAMAIIVFVLKLLFGLDGVTERKLSNLAKIINRDFDGKQPFNWIEWMKYINTRTAVCSHYHPSLREKYYPNSRVGGPDPFLSQWDNTPVRQILLRKHVIDNTIKDTVRRTLRGLMSDPVDPFPPSKTPLTSAINIILSKKQINLSQNVRNILNTDFKEYSVNYILSPDIEDFIEKKFNFTYSPELGCEHLKVKPTKFQSTTTRPFKSKNIKKIKLYLTDNERKIVDEEKPQQSIIKDESNTSNRLKNEDIYYFPHYYWIYRGNFRKQSTTVSQFDNLASEFFPESFLWLLRYCSSIIGQPIRDLYLELKYVQDIYFKFKF
ncbi:hypothetical protein O3M35_011993 [Rhynocoris fuscipes]|uniref:TATA box-binding protein-associated factor RNA polymerase I subunit B n=1 Tax=Rhynocoris fuscipes TaxID=488301 RepID=A0AAW1CY82_9HEMI